MGLDLIPVSCLLWLLIQEVIFHCIRGLKQPIGLFLEWFLDFFAIFCCLGFIYSLLSFIINIDEFYVFWLFGLLNTWKARLNGLGCRIKLKHLASTTLSMLAISFTNFLGLVFCHMFISLKARFRTFVVLSVLFLFQANISFFDNWFALHH